MAIAETHTSNGNPIAHRAGVLVMSILAIVFPIGVLNTMGVTQTMTAGGSLMGYLPILAAAVALGLPFANPVLEKQARYADIATFALAVLLLLIALYGVFSTMSTLNAQDEQINRMMGGLAGGVKTPKMMDLSPSYGLVVIALFVCVSGFRAFKVLKSIR